MKNNNVFGERLRKLREDKGMTQKEVSNIVGTTDNAIGNYERGSRMPDAGMLNRLSDIFGVSIDYMLGKTDTSSPSDEISNALESDPELAEFWDELKEREDLQLLFKQTKSISPKGIQQIIRIIKAIEDEEDREDG